MSAAPAARADAPPPTPDDPLFRAQWNLRAVGAPQAWALSTGAGVVVAVLDTGVAYEDRGPYRQAPDLGRTRLAAGWDFVDGTAHPDDRTLPGRPGHGTHVAGTIAQTTGNGLGASGVAPDATIMPIRVLAADGSGTAAATANGLRYAVDHGASVADLSLGTYTDSPELAGAVADALARGVTVVASAGNDGADRLTYPAAYPGVIAVGATRFDGTRPAYSNHGPGLSLMAPGGDLSVDQDGDGLDDGIVQQTIYGDPGTFCFCFVEGTSSAAAHVAGAAAVLIASGWAVTPAEVRAALLSSARPLGTADEDGAGLLQIPGALAAARAARGAGGAIPPRQPAAAVGSAAGAPSPSPAPAAVGAPSGTRPASPGAAAVTAAAAVAAVAAVLGRRRRRSTHGPDADRRDPPTGGKSRPLD